MAPPISHDQPTLDIYLDLVSEHSTVPVNRTNVTAQSPQALPPGGARNTSVRIDAVENKGLRGDRTTFYERLDLGEELAEEDLTIIVPQTATMAADCLEGLNERLGTGIQASDIVNQPIDNETVTFVFSNQCYAYTGEVTVALLRFEDDERPLLSDAVYARTFTEFPLSEGDYNATPASLLLGLVNDYNGLSLSLDDVFFDVPQPNEDSEQSGDTFVTLYTTSTSVYRSSVTLYYNRLDLSGMYPDGVEVPYGQYADLVEALPGFNDTYGFQLDPFDIVNASLSPTARLRGAPYSLLLKPDTGPILSVADAPEPEDVFQVQSFGGEDLTTMGGDSWVTVPVTKQPLQDAIAQHCSACFTPGGCPPVQTRACENGQDVMDDPGATQAEVNEATASLLASVELENEMTMGAIEDFEFVALDNPQGAFFHPDYASSGMIGAAGQQTLINVNASGQVGAMPMYQKGFVRNQWIRMGVELGVSFSADNGTFSDQSSIDVTFYQGRNTLTPFPPLPEQWEEAPFHVRFSCGFTSGGHNGVRVILTTASGDVQTLLLPDTARVADALLVMDSISRKIGIVVNGGYYVLGNWTGTVVVPKVTLNNEQAMSETLDTRLSLRCYASDWQGEYSLDDLTDMNGQSPGV